MKTMKILMLCLLLVFVVSSCEKDEFSQPYEENSTKNVTPSNLRVNPNDRINENLEILALGLIDLSNNSNIRALVNVNVIPDTADDFMTLTKLKDELQNLGINLLNEMRQSIIIMEVVLQMLQD